MTKQDQIQAHDQKMADAIATPIADYPVDMSVKPEI